MVLALPDIIKFCHIFHLIIISALQCLCYATSVTPVKFFCFYLYLIPISVGPIQISIRSETLSICVSHKKRNGQSFLLCQSSSAPPVRVSFLKGNTAMISNYGLTLRSIDDLHCFFHKNPFYKNHQAENQQIFKKVLRIIVRLILYFLCGTFILGGFHRKIPLLAVN